MAGLVYLLSSILHASLFCILYCFSQFVFDKTKGLTKSCIELVQHITQKNMIGKTLFFCVCFFVFVFLFSFV